MVHLPPIQKGEKSKPRDPPGRALAKIWRDPKGHSQWWIRGYLTPILSTPVQASQVICIEEASISRICIQGVRIQKLLEKNTYLIRNQTIKKLPHTLSLMRPRSHRQGTDKVSHGPALQQNKCNYIKVMKARAEWNKHEEWWRNLPDPPQTNKRSSGPSGHWIKTNVEVG